ncbi:MAG: glycosyltransferase family 4 protein [Candidatus Omnitrophica bacterium]|nr:glycosyltransferase family 4 protein [Candidatus Omnitrophota bacterium]
MAIIGIDATSVSLWGKGLSVYQYGFIRALAAAASLNDYYIFLDKNNPLPQLPSRSNFYYIKTDIPNRIIWDQFQLPALIKKYKIDLYYTSHDTLPLFSRIKLVTYLFEIPDYRLSSAAKTARSLYARASRAYIRSIFKPSLKNAHVIIVSSQSTKSDLVNKYGVPQAKVRVVYPDVDDLFVPAKNEQVKIETRKKYNAEEGYVLHISSNDPRDNTAVVIRAFHKAMDKFNLRKKLIIAGDVGFIKGALEELIKELSLGGQVIFTGYFPSDQYNRLVELYQAADLYIDPSLYEGFGLQVLEAMSCGLPVVTSNVTSLPEIVGIAGIMVEPDDIDGLASAMAKILSSSQVMRDMSQISLEKVKEFSWEKHVREVLKICAEKS